MADTDRLQALIQSLADARASFEQGVVPYGLDALLAQVEAIGIAGLKDIPAGVRGLVEEGPLPISFPMLAASLALSEVHLSLHLMESRKVP